MVGVRIAITFGVAVIATGGLTALLTTTPGKVRLL